MEAFMEMHANKLSALAVVDDDGKLCGNLSASDLKGFQLFFANFDDLFKPVSEFLSAVRKMQGRAGNHFCVDLKNRKLCGCCEERHAREGYCQSV